MPLVYQLITHLHYWLLIRKLHLQQPVRAPDPAWVGFLLCIAMGQTYVIQDGRELKKQFGVTLTHDVQIIQSFVVMVDRRMIRFLLIVSGFAQ
jgi:hypothetical protein